MGKDSVIATEGRQAIAGHQHGSFNCSKRQAAAAAAASSKQQAASSGAVELELPPVDAAQLCAAFLSTAPKSFKKISILYYRCYL
jgi:hypothetical protein